jgi:nitrite reductase/ring-hydroxylating ferredoxin subunit
MACAFSRRRGMIIVFVCLLNLQVVSSFHFVLMPPKGSQRIKSLADELNKEPANLGQEITGVTLPGEGQIKGWEFGDAVRVACANVDGSYFAVQGQCPRCAFDLWKGDLIENDPAWEDLPRLACPTCSTTYSLRSGRPGPPLKRNGVQAIVANLALTSTKSDAGKVAKAFLITRDAAGRVYCKERKSK